MTNTIIRWFHVPSDAKKQSECQTIQHINTLHGQIFCFLKNVVTDPNFDFLNSFQSFAKAWCWTIKWICRDSLSFRRESISKVTLMLTDGGSEPIYSKSVEPTSRAPLWNLNDKWDTMPTSWTRVKYAIWDRVEAQAWLKYLNLLMRRVSTYFGHVVY